MCSPFGVDCIDVGNSSRFVTTDGKKRRCKPQFIVVYWAENERFAFGVVSDYVGLKASFQTCKELVEKMKMIAKIAYYKAGALFLARRSQRLRRTLRRSFSTDYEERGRSLRLRSRR